MEDKIVYIELDNWYDMKEATQYLNELENGEHDADVNYASVWYDMAIVYCITTTENYAIKHDIISRKVEKNKTIFGSYFPEYDSNNFGCSYDNEYQGWAPYKDFNNAILKKIKNENIINK